MTRAGTQARTYPEGVTSWVDIEVDDVDAAQAFYGGLFGWTFTQATPPEAPARYLVGQLDGQDVAGIGSRAESSTATPTWNTYVAVDDIEAAASRVVAAGGRVIDPPADAGEGGRAATCADPAGVQFRLWQAHRRLGAQISNTPGSWNFSDLVAADPGASARFYGQVFGWEFDDLGFSTMVRCPATATTWLRRSTRTSTSVSRASEYRPGSPMRSGGSTRHVTTSTPAGGSRSPWPTATRLRRGQRRWAARWYAGRTQTGPRMR